MSGKLLDTNAVIALQKSEPAFLQFLDSDDELLVPAIVIGELYLGAYNSGRVNENIRVIDEFVAGNKVLACDAETGKYYGQIRYQLRGKGRPIPENDIWIAAIALQHTLTLVTRDAHFKEVDGLTVEAW